MSDWQVGDLALCVDARQAAQLVEGSVYTVSGIDGTSGLANLDGAVLAYGLWVREAHPTNGVSFDNRRFRKIRPDEHAPCEEEFVELLNRSKQPEKLPMTDVLSRFGDVPESFVAAEREFERGLQELRDWVRSTRQVQS